MSIAPVFFMLATLPCGVAIQKFSLSIVFIWLLTKVKLITSVPKQLIFPVFVWLSLILAGAYNNSWQHAVKWAIGHSEWVILPLLTYWTTYSPTREQRNKIKYILTAGMLLLALISISQALMGWKLSGTTIVVSEHRARGFFSHPLTLAYSTLFLWPLSLSLYLRKRSFIHIIFAASTLIVLTLTMSRIIHILTIGLSFFIVYQQAPTNGKKYIWISAPLFLIALFLIPNPIGDRLIQTVTVGIDRHSTFQFDRIAFWKVHWNMFLDRPWLGHGTAMTNSYRIPWYEQIGLFNFRKPYPAHNMYLQMLVEGGVLTLLLFLGWIASVFGSIRNLQSSPLKSIYLLTWGAFLLGSLTQNTIQDSVVRLYLTLFLCSLVITGRAENQTGTATTEV